MSQHKALRALVGDRTIAFQAAYARITGSVTAGLFLAQCLYWQGKMGWGRWWWKTQDDWEAETTLSRFQQEQARKKLSKLGILEDQRKGLPAKVYFRVDLDKLVEALEGLESSMRETSNLECEELADRSVSFSQPVQESTQEKKAGEPPSVAEASPRPLPGQSDCTAASPHGQEEEAEEDEDGGVFLVEDEPEPEPSLEKPPRKPRGSPGGVLGTGPTYMVWAEFWSLLEASGEVTRPARIDGRTAGRIKRDLIADYGQQRATQLCRLAVLDWPAIQSELWKASKRGKLPSMEDVIDLRHDLAPYLETGVTSNQHRISQFKKRFVKQAEADTAETETVNPLKAALRKKRGDR